MDYKKNPKTGKKKEKVVKKSEDTRMMEQLDSKVREMETEFDIGEHLVIDLGNAYTKIGFSGEDLPKEIIPSLYARNKMFDKKNEIGAFDQKMDVFGYEATEPQYETDYDLFHLTCGDHKERTSKEYLEFLKDALENKMGLSTSEYDVIVNISPIKNEENIKAYGRLFIDELNFKGLAMINSSSLSLFATGKTTGVIVQCGECRTYTVPIYEGFPLYHALNKARVGGRVITDIFRAGVEENKIAIKGGDIHTLRQIIEKTCSVQIEFDYNYYLDENNQDIIKKETQLFKLPDETIVSIPRKTRVLASELLFNPKVWENTKNELGLIDLITGSIKKTEMIDKNFKESLVENVVLSGGTSMMENFPQRVENDLKGYKEEDGFELEYEPIVDAAINRNIGKWIGMGMISRMSAFDKLFIKKQDYQELGEERLSELSQIF
jgi:actin-related protein